MDKPITNKKINIMREFINTTFKLTQDLDFDSITVRLIAKNTNYNSSTLYYYFTNYDNLMTYVALKYINNFFIEKQYIDDNYINSLDRYLKTWNIFIKYVVKYPHQFNLLIFGSYADNLPEIVNNYSLIFPNSHIKDIYSFPIFRKSKYDYEIPLLLDCISHGYIKINSKNKIIELSISILKTLIEKCLLESNDLNPKDLIDRYNEYIELFIINYKTPIASICTNKLNKL